MTKKTGLLVLCAAAMGGAGCGGGAGGGPGGAQEGAGTAGPAVVGTDGTRSQAVPEASLPSSATAADPRIHIGVQPVPDTPVRGVPAHGGHEPLLPALESPAPAAPPAAPQYGKEWVVSPQGSDTAAGTAGAPFRSIGKAVSVAGPGELIRVQAGTYAEAISIGSQAQAGRPDARITLQGEGSPKLVPSGGEVMLAIARPHWIVDGFELDGQNQPVFPVTFEGDTQGSILANSEIHRASHGAAINVHGKARGVTIQNNHIHHVSRGEDDSHGVVVQTTTKDTVVRNNDIHDVSGDSVQCLGPEGYSSNAPAEGLVIESNHFYANRENGVDIKTCKDVVIRNNRMHGFRMSSSSRGDAVVVHLSATRVLVEGNDIYDSGKGISVGGNRQGPLPSGIVLRHNRIHDLVTVGGTEGVGIRLENSDGTQVLNNTLTNIPGFALVIGHGTGGPTQNLVVKNNIVDALKRVDLGGARPGLVMDRNLYSPAGTFRTGEAALGFEAWRALGLDASSVQASPEFASQDGLQPGAGAVNRGVDVGLAFCGGAPDIGAVETGC